MPTPAPSVRPARVCRTCVKHYRSPIAEFNQLERCPDCGLRVQDIGAYADWYYAYEGPRRAGQRRTISKVLGGLVYAAGLLTIMFNEENLGLAWLPAMIGFSLILAVGWVVGGRLLDFAFSAVEPMELRQDRKSISHEFRFAFELAARYWLLVFSSFLVLGILGLMLLGTG